MVVHFSRSSAKKVPVRKTWADIVKTGKRNSVGGAKRKSITAGKKAAVKRPAAVKKALSSKSVGHQLLGVMIITTCSKVQVFCPGWCQDKSNNLFIKKFHFKHCNRNCYKLTHHDNTVSFNYPEIDTTSSKDSESRHQRCCTVYWSCRLA